MHLSLWEMTVVSSEIYVKRINTVCGQNAKLLNVKADGSYSYHCF